MLKSLEINGFKSFSNKSKLVFDAPISAIVGPNGSGKSNAAEAFRFVLGEQSLKALRARHTDELLYNGGPGGRRRNRAHVKAVFDNGDGLLDIDYDEVAVERIIQRGDASTYRINGSQVRLRDVTDLLSDANIGTSRHHIISQGEADRILNVHEGDRKSIIEDALGLQRFYRRRREAVRKLDKTEDNLNQAEARRRDLLPELKFLNQQKERIEETENLRVELTDKYQKYFKRESVLLTHRLKELTERKGELEEQQRQLREQIKETKKTANDTAGDSGDNAAVKDIKEQIRAAQKKVSALTESLGEINGQLQMLERQQGQQQEREPRISIPNNLFRKHKQALEALLSEADDASDEAYLELFKRLREAVNAFLDDVTESDTDNQPAATDHGAQITELQERREELRQQRSTAEETLQTLEKQLADAQSETRQQEQAQHEAEKELLELTAREENTTAELERVSEQLEETRADKEQLEDEKSEARILCGKSALETTEAPLVNADGEVVDEETLLTADTRSNREFRRQLERLKIKLEDTRVADKKEVLDEYDRVSSQVEFLASEIADLKESKESLQTLIDEIEETVAEKFDAGIQAINEAFSDFFATMFGGGSAELYLTEHPVGRKGRVEELDEEPDETERGVGITVQLPKKKIRGLGVLSGGERSLVSIALLFALSQINPPPFVVLDEADAALDEANSRRFGEMIDRLSDRSQLIIITHNRETMSRADLLYGVTMDQSGGSRLLSLNFSEAVETVEE